MHNVYRRNNISVTDVQNLNALSSIEVTPFYILILVNPLQDQYAASPIVLTLDGIVSVPLRVDGVDATLVLREYTLLLSGESGNFSSSQSTAANVNGDEKVDGINATLILRYYNEALSLTSGTMPDMEE